VPHAIHVLDRFHVMQKMSKAIDKVRAAEVKQLKADGYEPLLKGCRWLLLMRPENQSEKQAVKLSELLQYNSFSARRVWNLAPFVERPGGCSWRAPPHSVRETDVLK